VGEAGPAEPPLPDQAVVYVQGDGVHLGGDDALAVLADGRRRMRGGNPVSGCHEVTPREKFRQNPEQKIRSLFSLLTSNETPQAGHWK
jgi:hypothetical protein